MTDRQPMFLAGEGGNLYYYEPEEDMLVTLFKDDEKETLMGLEKKGDFLYVGAKSRIFKFNKFLKLDKTFSVAFRGRAGRPEFHQMTIINNFLYVTVTHRNQIWKFDLDLNLLNIYDVSPPDKNTRVKWNFNYNHINNIFYHNEKYYLCLNMLRKAYRSSGVCVLDKNMKEIERFEYGWEAHNFIFLDNKKYILTGSSGAIKPVGHTHKGGLLVDGELVFEYDPDLYFCKDFSVNQNYIYIVGGTVKMRDYRGFADGILFILDRFFKPIFERRFTLSGGFCGCLLASNDLSKISN